MDMELADKVAWVTGATGAIGREIALGFAREGAKVAVSARSEDALAALVGEIDAKGGTAMAAVLDVTDPEVLPADNPLYDMPNVFLTPHISGSLGTEIERLTDLIVAELNRFSRGLQLHHQVKREHLSRLA